MGNKAAPFMADRKEQLIYLERMGERQGKSFPGETQRPEYS